MERENFAAALRGYFFRTKSGIGSWQALAYLGEVIARDAHGDLCMGELSLARLAEQFGTPVYVYDLDAIEKEAEELRGAFENEPHLVCYAVKANTAGPIVRALADVGCGADVVSGGELAVALRSGVAPDKIVYSGVAKSDSEIDQAIGSGPNGLLAIQIESVEELLRVQARARTLGRRARVSLRLNPEVHIEQLDTHEHIATGHDEAKFGIPRLDVGAALALAQTDWTDFVGLATHAGSQFTNTDAYAASAAYLFDIACNLHDSLRARLAFVDTGGGFGIDYGAGCPVRPRDFVIRVRQMKKACGLSDVALHVEPGRALVGSHGVLLASVVQSKVTPYGAAPNDRSAKRWLMIDAGMNDLLRPALYRAHHRVVPLTLDPRTSRPSLPWRVVGPVCESSDDFGLHDLPALPPPRVALLDAGAYGFSMASEYNGRALATEVFVRGHQVVASLTNRSVAAWVNGRLG